VDRKRSQRWLNAAWSRRSFVGDARGGHGLQVTVVIKLTAATPALALLIDPAAIFTLPRSAIGEVVYF
jgi:hypothetical protein